MNITTENAGGKICFFCGTDRDVTTFKKLSHKPKLGFRVTLCPECAEEIYNLSFFGADDYEEHQNDYHRDNMPVSKY